ncbi:DivIVA domain-containing protein [Mycobacterium kubicae]|uniref:DivIVA domain-containing protein n=1 Tax=Mycobacterium kubicae TaxID=120959 RepID=UPI000800A57F|nr:DivIVA domain-containing protein [Mycobacterium kubicae]OBF20835.1 cell division protein DivIVA [Mycobacterium kubicae]OBK50001.1 cell division protein DivIVA [Mycobacterium kubicae]
MALVLLYLVVLILVAIVLFGVASLLFGRGEQLPPLPRATTATVLPAYGVTGADVDAVKFTQVLRGYKTSEVDWVLDRLGREIETLRGQLAAIQASSSPGSPEDADEHADELEAVPDAEAVAQERSGPT